MCKQGEQYQELITTAEGRPAGVDPCIAKIIQALNDAGVSTIASCCGHDHRPGNIVLRDGREIFICRNFEEARSIDKLFYYDIHGRDMRQRSDTE